MHFRGVLWSGVMIGKGRIDFFDLGSCTGFNQELSQLEELFNSGPCHNNWESPKYEQAINEGSQA